MLRASGVAYDVRRARPYDFYDQFDWDVAIAPDGDNFARYLVRMEEMRQSLKIIRQALDIFPGLGPRQLGRLARRAAAEGRRLPRHGIPDLPLQDHHGRHPGPEGERYEWIEGANGELGFYAISDGAAAARTG